MTLDELNVQVSVSADEALERLDALIERARTLCALYGADGIKLPVDGEGLRAGADAAAAFVSGLSGLHAVADKGARSLGDMNAALRDTGAAEAGRGAADMRAEMERADKSASALAASAREMERRWGAISAIRKNIQQFRDLRAEYQKVETGGKGATTAFEQLKAAAGRLGLDLDGSRESLDGCTRSVDALEKNVTLDAQSMVGALATMLMQAQQTEAGLNIRAAMGVDVSQPLSAIQAVIAVINALLSLMGQAGIQSAGDAKRAGGGGGGSRSSGTTSAPSVKPAGKSKLESEYERIAHQRHMNEISLERELELVEALRRKHRMTAEEIVDWEERVYDLRQELAQRDAQSVDRLADGVKDALVKRYEAMRDAELTRLDDSRAAWEDWRDGSVAAIEEQIVALDRLGDTEDREAKDAQELRKIEKLRREIEYEQDAFNRIKLRQQLDAAMQSRAERPRKLELGDQKAALEAKVEQIERQTDAELAALDERAAAIEAAYAKRLEDAAIQSEAEKLLLRDGQREILALLSGYAPQYDALGRSLGERLLKGFRSAVGDVAGWFEGLSAELASAQESAARGLAVGLAGAPGAGITITQQNTFTQPVETPSETARRVREANEALAEEILRTV